MKKLFFIALTAILSLQVPSLAGPTITPATIDSLINKVIELEDKKEPRYYKEALALAEQTLKRIPSIKGGYKKGEGNCYLEIGLCLAHLGEHNKALEYFGKALDIRTKLGDPAAIASVYNNMSSSYLALYLVTEALNCSRRAINLYRESKDTCRLLRAYNNYANVLDENLSLLDSAIIYNEMALNLISRACKDDTAAWINAEYGLAKRLLKKDDDGAAKLHFSNTLNLGRLQGDSSAVAMALQGLGAIALKVGDIKEAEEKYESAKTQFLLLEDSLNLTIVYQNLADLHRADDRFSEAETLYDSALQFLGGRVFPGNNMSEAIKKSKQLNIESGKKYFQRNLLSCIIIIVLLIAALYYRRYGKVKEENTELKENVLIERENNVKAQEALNKTNEALLDAREESIIIREQQTKTQEELYRTSAELLKTRGEALSLREQKAQAQEELNIYKAEMLKAEQSKLEKEKEILRLRSLVHWGIKNTLETIKAHLESSSEIGRFKLKNMIDEAILKLKEHDFGPLRLELFVEKMHITAKDHVVKEVEFTYEIDDAKAYEIKGGVHGNLKAIVELAFANIRNHAQCTTASLNFTVNGNELIMEIKDNGIGFEMPPPPGTGINDIKARTAEIGGKCNIVSAKGEGTTIKIIVPDPFSFGTSLSL